MMMETIVYAGRCKDKRVLEKSSSGGAFTVLTDFILNEGNAVLCAYYNYDKNLTEFHLIQNIKDRDLSRGSMYMQSSAGDTWKEAVHWLKEHPDRMLMYIGMGCQAAGFLRFSEMMNLRERIIVIDIICHGAPSPKIWKDYIESLVGSEKISDLNFRDKRTGWSHSVGVAKVNDEEISLSKYRRVYSGRWILRKCCSVCPYTTMVRKSDITIGDFWHIEKSMPEFQDEMGTSLFLIHTERGRQLFDNILQYLDYKESNTIDCWQLNLEKPTEHASDREAFWTDYQNSGITYTMEKYGTITFFEKIKRKIRDLYFR